MRTTETMLQKEPGSARMVAVMGAIGLISSVLLVATYQVTLPYVEANREAYLEAAVFDVLPGAVHRIGFAPDGHGGLARLEAGATRGLRLFAGYDADGRLVGVAVEAKGQGFQDVLRILYGYVPACACVVGMKVLESKETPGLGDKIEKDAAFLANFDSLDVRLAPDGQRLLHGVGLVKQGAEREAWEIAAITGATISSRAIATIINSSAAEVLPLIETNLDVLRDGGR